MTTHRLSLSASAVYLALWMVVMFVGHSQQVVGRPLDLLFHPVWTAARLIDRNLDVATGVDELGGSWRGEAWKAWVHPERAASLDVAIFIQTDLAEGFADSATHHDAELASRRLSLLLCEADRLDEALSSTSLDSEWREVLEHLYSDAPQPAESETATERLVLLAPALAVEPEGWLSRRVRARAARLRGDVESAEELEAAAAADTRRRALVAEAIAAPNAALMALGLALLLVIALRPAWRGPNRLRDPPWSTLDGLGVWIRADFWNRCVYLAIAWLPASFVATPLGEALRSFATPIAALPLGYLVWRHLLRPARDAHADPLGLRPRRADAMRLGGVALAALAVDLVGTYGLSWGAWWLDFVGHWSEGLDETLVWGSSFETSALALDYLAWTPLVEEVGFRGVLFLSLRRQLGPAQAALASSLLFAGLHFYSVPGFVGTLLSGLMWAWAFERSASLWPGVLAHSLYNAVYVATQLLVYR